MKCESCDQKFNSASGKELNSLGLLYQKRKKIVFLLDRPTQMRMDHTTLAVFKPVQ